MTSRKCSYATDPDDPKEIHFNLTYRLENLRYIAAKIIHEMAKSRAQNNVRPAKKGDKGTVKPLEAPVMKENEKRKHTT